MKLSRKWKLRGGAIAAVLVGGIVLSACGGGSNTPSAVAQNQRVSNSILKQFNAAQPVPVFKWSQYRQTLIDIETAEATGAQTTTFFFDPGTQAPIASCPSIGFPIASTSELTSPDQALWNYSGSNGVAGTSVGQIDPNGVYTGNSSGTYVLCIRPNGQTYANYWEGFVSTVSGPARWSTRTNSIEMTGASTTTFHVGKP